MKLVDVVANRSLGKPQRDQFVIDDIVNDGSGRSGSATYLPISRSVMGALTVPVYSVGIASSGGTRPWSETRRYNGEPRTGCGQRTG
jgi:hypothetical protein